MKNETSNVKQVEAENVSLVNSSSLNIVSLQIGPSDQLSAPSHFPQAVVCYTLKEMSVVWHLFGGRDFGGTSSRDQKKK